MKSATRVVLPEPAGAVTSVTACARFCCMRSLSRGRGRSDGAGRGGRRFGRRRKVGNCGAVGAGGCVSCGSASWGCGTFLIAYCFLDAARRAGAASCSGRPSTKFVGCGGEYKGKRQEAKGKNQKSF